MCLRLARKMNALNTPCMVSQMSTVNAKLAMGNGMVFGALKSVRRIVEKVQKVFALVVENATDAKQVITADSVIKRARRTAQTACSTTTWCMLLMVNRFSQQELAQISARSILTAADVTNRAQQIVQRPPVCSTASEFPVARRRTANALHVTSQSGGEKSVRTHAPKAVRMMSAIKKTVFAKVNARTAFLEENVMRNARMAAKVVAATRRRRGAMTDANQAGVATNVMKPAQKAQAQRAVIERLVSLFRVSLAVIPSKAFFKTGGYARLVQTTATTRNAMFMACALKDVNSDSMGSCACQTVAHIALAHVTLPPLVRKMDIVPNVRLASQGTSAT